MKISDIQKVYGTDVHEKALKKYQSELNKIHPLSLLDYCMGEDPEHREGMTQFGSPVDVQLDPKTFLTMLGHLRTFSNSLTAQRASETRIKHLDKIEFLAKVAITAETDPDAALLMKMRGD